MIYEVTEGMTKPLRFTLKADGVAVDLTGMTVTYNLYTMAGTAVDTAGDIVIVTPSAGLVEYSPDAADFVADNGPYTSKFKVIDGAGKIDFYPRGQGDTCRIYKP